MTRYLMALAFWAMAACANAQDLGLTPLQTGDDVRGWEAVGRIDIDGRGFCTGALIAPNLVLTAAHCLYDRDTGAPLAPEDLQFLAGWRNGRAVAYRDIRRFVTPTSYAFDARVSNISTRHDLALLELAQPIRQSQIRPFRTANAVAPGDEVGVVSYAHDRAEAPSLEEVCDVLSTEGEVVVVSCSIDFGSSGAPIFQFVGDEAFIVSVVSAKATLDGAPVALGTALMAPLAELRAQLAMDDSLFQTPPPREVRVITSGERVDTGAHFVTVGD